MGKKNGEEIEQLFSIFCDKGVSEENSRRIAMAGKIDGEKLKSRFSSLPRDVAPDVRSWDGYAVSKFQLHREQGSNETCQYSHYSSMVSKRGEPDVEVTVRIEQCAGQPGRERLFFGFPSDGYYLIVRDSNLDGRTGEKDDYWFFKNPPPARGPDMFHLVSQTELWNSDKTVSSSVPLRGSERSDGLCLWRPDEPDSACLALYPAFDIHFQNTERAEAAYRAALAAFGLLKPEDCDDVPGGCGKTSPR